MDRVTTNKNLCVVPPGTDRPTWHIGDRQTLKRGEFLEDGTKVSGDLELDKETAAKMIRRHLEP